jgi:hypothetical protein
MLPRGLFTAAAAGAMLVAAVLVIGCLAGGLVTGTWAPGAQVASVSGGPVTLAEAPAPRSEPARVPARRPQVEPRAPVVRAAAAPRPRPRRVRLQRPAAAKPPAVAPAPTAAAVPASVVSQVSNGSRPDTSTQPKPKPKPKPARSKPQKKQATQLSATPALRSSAGTDVPPGSRGKGHGRGHGTQPTPPPAPSVGYDKHADKGTPRHSGR